MFFILHKTAVSPDIMSDAFMMGETFFSSLFARQPMVELKYQVEGLYDSKCIRHISAEAQ